MQIHLHQTHINIADFEEVFEYLKRNFESKKRPGIHLLPELFLTGYPLQDLCLSATFINRYQYLLKELKAWAKKHIQDPDTLILLGGLDYKLDNEKLPLEIKNVIFKIYRGEIHPIYTKKLLPNYDIFDEKKYFTEGNGEHIIEFQEEHFGLLICEDMWHSSVHKVDPIEALLQEKTQKGLDLKCVFNLSASPFHLGKDERRINRAIEISNILNCPFAYINRVGAEDEILFDGSSFITDGRDVMYQAPLFEESFKTLEVPPFNADSIEKEKTESNTLESLFTPSLTQQNPVTLKKWSDEDCAKALAALSFGLNEYMEKCYFKKITIALSGGIDSALVLAIAALARREKKERDIEAIYMPSQYSSTLSYDLSTEICQRLSIPLIYFPIKFLHSAINNAYTQNIGTPLQGVADENIQSRLRGALLYGRSNSAGSMVINTSNKSELAVGYSTQYGDSVGAISLLGDLYKSEVFWLADYINRKFGEPIPEGIIARAPSAELRENQEDSHSLPPYERLDAILEGLLAHRLTKADLIKKGQLEEEIDKVFDLYRKSEYKRVQFCPIIKVKAKSFGFGYRIPICKNSKFYHF
jgi:NAD+ synthase (glutamine-hydrolysing)